MLRTIKELKGMPIGATDGEIGAVEDAYFDDEKWVLRYLVADTSRWLPGRKVLISPHAIRGVELHGKHLDVTLTRDQVKHGPEIDTDMPVSRQHEISLLDYYRYPYYWAGPLTWGMDAVPNAGLATAGAIEEETQTLPSQQPEADPHLRSANEMAGYHIEATDGPIGHVRTVIFDDKTWELRFLIIDTHDWLAGRHVLISPDWVSRVSWEEHTAYVNLSREAIRESPEYEPAEMLTEEEEAELYHHYGKDKPSHPHRASH
jgi:uncharacterized protein YrrD